MGAVGILEQYAFRGRNDDGSEAAATWKAALNTNFSQAVDTIFRVRFLTGSATISTICTPQLQYNLNSAGWVNVTTSSSVVKGADSAFITDNEATTKQLAAGAFTAGVMVEDGLAAAAFWDSNQREYEYVVQIVGADVNNGDTIQLRVANVSSPLSVYDATPSLTVVKAVTAALSKRGATFGFYGSGSYKGGFSR